MTGQYSKYHLKFLYIGTPLYGHPLNTDTPVLRTVLLGTMKTSYIFSKINPLNTDSCLHSMEYIYDKIQYSVVEINHRNQECINPKLNGNNQFQQN